MTDQAQTDQALNAQALSVPELLSLKSGEFILEIAPGVGGSIAAFYSPAREGRARIDWLRPASPAALAARDPLGMASFPLMPWCNRLRGGKAQAYGDHGRSIQLVPNYQDSPHTIHGVAWQQPWQLIECAPDSALLEFVYRPVESLETIGDSIGWPWAFSAWQSFKLDASGLACQVTLRNDSEELMPFGLGHHPYFPHLAGTRLQCDFSPEAQMWEGDAECLPTGMAQPAFLQDLREGMELAPLNLDNNFTGWQRRFTVDWPGLDGSQAHRQLTLTAASPLDFFVLYCPQGLPFFCAEPVSNCTDWLNQKTQFPADSLGGGELAPGASCSTTFRMDATFKPA